MIGVAVLTALVVLITPPANEHKDVRFANGHAIQFLKAEFGQVHTLDQTRFPLGRRLSAEWQSRLGMAPLMSNLCS